ncbi:histidine kinase [Myxococcaceae bacterium JPH2]|nr:histidine kinase [Myxococcaceae bacterium JPH2]
MSPSPWEREMDLPPEEAARRVNQLVRRITLAAVTALHALLLWTLWGKWGRMALVTAVFVAVTAINLVLARAFFSRHTRVAEALRVGLNLLATLLYGTVSDWAVPAWLYLPLNSLWVDGYVDPTARRRLGLLLVLVAGVALLDGCDPMLPACFLLLSLLVGLISEARVFLTHQAMRGLDRQHQALARAHAALDEAHRRAHEQERLSSLGLLAAGVAHEINNPMSYVKSNVNSLLVELKATPNLSPLLNEYVEDVLPATLDGIRRVTAIVADLRRFARGDPEALTEYDLNDEVAVALRITRSQLHPRCEVVPQLGEVPVLLGRPGQIAQVVVNLLMNASQAMPEGGRIVVSTQRVQDHAVLQVSDTGMGMTADVRARMFEPFFTTKPVGEGTGMGLSVVHGIITTHHGRIDVESQPRQGSTFTIRLPLHPPYLMGLAASAAPESHGA